MSRWNQSYFELYPFATEINVIIKKYFNKKKQQQTHKSIIMKLTLNLSLLLLSASMANAATIVEFDGECNYENLKEASGLNEARLISLLTGGGTDQAAAEEATEAACLDAQSRYSDPRKTACKCDIIYSNLGYYICPEEVSPIFSTISF